MCGMGLIRQSNNYQPTPDRIQELVNEGYKYILLVNKSDYDVFTMLKLCHQLPDGNFLVMATDKKHLSLSKWEFAEHTWESNKVGWRGTYFGSIKFIFDKEVD